MKLRRELAAEVEVRVTNEEDGYKMRSGCGMGVNVKGGLCCF